MTTTQPQTQLTQTLLDRLESVQQADIQFVPNSEFDEQDIADVLAADAFVAADSPWSVPKDLPGHLARLCQTKLLSADEERSLFRRMNFLKFAACSLRSGLHLDQLDRERLGQIEWCLQEAAAIRDHIVQANMRLVMSIVKKMVTPQHSFDDLLSEGIVSIMTATDKFDFARGFRFSTYAYRAITRNTFRRIYDRQKEDARYAVNSEEVVFDVMDESSSSSVKDAAWDLLRQLLAKFTNQLDRRERFIIRSRYALGSHRKVKTFQSLADILGVSKERVRQLESRAVTKLKRLAAELPLDDMYSPALD